MTEAARVVVVGFDAMDFRIARELMGTGRLPALAAMLERSAWAPTVTPPGLVVGAIWPSITTGSWPSRHGFYADRQLTVGTYRTRRAGPWEIEQPRVWEVLSAAGRQCAVLDVPLATPSAALHGVQLVEWGSHDRFLPTSSSPAEFAGDVVEQFGTFPVQPHCDAFAHDLPGLRDALLTGVDAHTRLATAFLDRPDWDFFMAVFSASHCAGHHFWRQHDRQHPQHDPALREQLGCPGRDLRATRPCARRCPCACARRCRGCAGDEPRDRRAP